MTAIHSCRRIAELLSRSLDEPLDLADRTQLRLHLFVCRNCRHVERQLDGIRTLAADLFGGALEEPAAPPQLPPAPRRPPGS